MTLFRNPTHQDLWLDYWCHRCFQPDEAQRRLQGKDTQCPIQARALASGRKPPEWDRNPRADEMVKQLRCNTFQARPLPTRGRATPVFEDVPLFDETPYRVDVGYVPVEGWPERPRGKETDHA